MGRERSAHQAPTADPGSARPTTRRALRVGPASARPVCTADRWKPVRHARKSSDRPCRWDSAVRACGSSARGAPALLRPPPCSRRVPPQTLRASTGCASPGAVPRGPASKGVGAAWGSLAPASRTSPASRLTLRTAPSARAPSAAPRVASVPRPLSAPPASSVAGTEPVARQPARATRVHPRTTCSPTAGQRLPVMAASASSGPMRWARPARTRCPAMAAWCAARRGAVSPSREPASRASPQGAPTGSGATGRRLARVDVRSRYRTEHPATGRGTARAVSVAHGTTALASAPACPPAWGPDEPAPPPTPSPASARGRGRRTGPPTSTSTSTSTSTPTSTPTSTSTSKRAPGRLNPARAPTGGVP
jgi:hypothetical protein